MKKMIGLLVMAMVGVLAPATLSASGSITAGRGINPRDAYTKGKALTYKKLACKSCPLQKGELDRARAQNLKNSFEARDSANKPGTPDDGNIQVLCPGSEAVGCDDGVDEQELVHYYLTRRYKL